MLSSLRVLMALSLVWVVGSACFDSQQTCSTDDQCGPTRVCRAAQCIVPCASDAVCGAGAICADGECQAGCRTSDQCALGQMCEEMSCVNGCDDSDRCEAYQYCSANGQCLNGCGRDGDCGAGQFCEDNKCVPIGGGFDAGGAQCASNDDCRVGEFCDPSGRCAVGCRPGTCPPGRTCDEQTGRCSGGQPPVSDAGAPAEDAGPVFDSGPEIAFDLRCQLSFGGNSVDSLQVRADGDLTIELMPEFDAEIEWSVERSPGDSGSVIWGEAVERVQPVALQRVGDYILRGHATYQGVTEHCDIEVLGRAPRRGYWFELGWDGDRDIDLHMVPVPNQEECREDRECAQNQLRRRECNLGYCTRSFDSRDGRDGDCWARNANPIWDDPNNLATNPHYLGDVRQGAGTENIALGELSRGWTYRVALRAWGENPNRAWFKIYRDGEAVVETQALRIGPEEPNPWLYLGRLNTEGYRPVVQLSSAPPRD